MAIIQQKISAPKFIKPQGSEVKNLTRAFRPASMRDAKPSVNFFTSLPCGLMNFWAAIFGYYCQAQRPIVTLLYIFETLFRRHLERYLDLSFETLFRRHSEHYLYVI